MTIRDEYINELRKVRTQLQAFVLLPEDMHLDFTDEEMAHIDKVIQRGEELADILEAIDAALGLFQHEAQRHALPAVDLGQVLAQKSTLDLLNITARHLSGQDVTVVIQDPQNPAAIGETFIEGDTLKIAISPRAVFDGDQYLRVFLHEVAHAKLHMDEACNLPAWKMEEEAEALGQYWQACTRWYADATRYAGEGSGPTRQFRSKLITLLVSPAAAERVAG